MMFCENGNVIGEDGCPVCQCNTLPNAPAEKKKESVRRSDKPASGMQPGYGDGDATTEGDATEEPAATTEGDEPMVTEEEEPLADEGAKPESGLQPENTEVSDGENADEGNDGKKPTKLGSTLASAMLCKKDDKRPECAANGDSKPASSLQAETSKGKNQPESGAQSPIMQNPVIVTDTADTAPDTAPADANGCKKDDPGCVLRRRRQAMADTLTDALTKNELTKEQEAEVEFLKDKDEQYRHPDTSFCKQPYDPRPQCHPSTRPCKKEEPDCIIRRRRMAMADGFKLKLRRQAMADGFKLK